MIPASAILFRMLLARGFNGCCGIERVALHLLLDVTDGTRRGYDILTLTSRERTLKKSFGGVTSSAMAHILDFLRAVFSSQFRSFLPAPFAGIAETSLMEFRTVNASSFTGQYFIGDSAGEIRSSGDVPETATLSSAIARGVYVR